MTVDFLDYLNGTLDQGPNVQGQPLSVRNNNPGNMRPVGAASGFQKFDDPQAGIDAMHKDLFAKITGNSPVMKSKFGAGYSPTISNLISTWAPSSENDTKSYIDAVSKKLGRSPDDVLSPDDIPQLSEAMIAHEGGGKASKYFGKGKEYAQADTGVMNDATQVDDVLPDLSKLSDEELDALEAQHSQPQLPDLSKLSDEELDKLEAGIATENLPGLKNIPDVGMPKLPVDNTPQVPFIGNDGKPMPPETKLPTDNLILKDKSSPDFIDRTIEDWGKRNQQLEDINASDYSGPGGQSIASTLFQTAGNIGGRAVDMGMNAAGSAGRYLEGVSPTVGKAVRGMADEVKGDVISSANPGFKDIADYVKSNPELARNLSAANDLAIVAPLAKPAGALAGIADNAVITGGKKFMDIIPDRPSAGVIPTADELHATASEAFKKLPLNEVALEPTGTNKFLSEIKALTPQTEAGKIVSGNNPLTKIVDRMAGKVDPETGEVIGGLKDRSMTLAEAQEVDEALGDHVDSLTDSTTGRLTKQGKKVLDIQNAFRKAVFEGNTKGGDQLNRARNQWAQAIRMRDVEKIDARAEMMENPITARKTGYRNLAMKLKKNSMGYTPQEIALINRAAKSGIATNVLKLMGSRLGPLMAGAAGGAAGGPLGAALAYGADYAVAGTARGLANKIHLGRDTAVKRAIAGREIPGIRPVAEAKATIPEEPAVPKQITYQPDYVAGSGANAVVRPNSPAEQVAAEAARQRAIDLGLTPQAVRNGAAFKSGNLSTNLEGKSGKPEISPKETRSLGTQDLEASSNSTGLPEPSGNLNTAQKSPESYLGPTINRPDINTSNPSRPNYHDLNDKSTLLDKAQEHLEPTIRLLNDITGDIPGAKVVGARVKDPETVDLKISRSNREPSQISDYLGSRIQIDNPEAADQVIKKLGDKAEIIHEDNFLTGTGRPESGYRAIHLQVKGKDGFSHEVQLIPKELMEVYDQERAVHDKWKDLRGNIPTERVAEYEADMKANKKIFTDAGKRWDKRINHESEGEPINVRSEGKVETAVTPAGDEIKVKDVLVEGDDLIASQHDDMRSNANYPQVLQPRDRSRFSSHQQISRLANNLNPRLLMKNPLTSEGAPIISKDGVVESGNGRVLGIRKAYNENPASAEKYKQALAEAGYDVKGMKKPILVRVRETPMNIEERVKLTQASNERSTSAMSATEQANKDATRLSAGTFDKFLGGDIKAMKNRPFIRSAIKDIVPESEQATIFTKDGGLSQEAERRINNAVLSKAYDDEAISQLLTENSDNELTSLGRALTHIAPAWAKMREAAKSGLIPENMDITPTLVDATKLILRARREGKPLSDYLHTKDLLGDDISQEVRDLVESLHQGNKLSKFISHEKIVNALTDYANEAGKVQPGVNLFGEKPLKPSEILDNSIKKARGEKNEKNSESGAENDTSGKDVR